MSGLAGRRAALRDAGVTAAAFRRKSSIIVAADDSTISWGPSPTFGELVSRLGLPEPPPGDAQKGGVVCPCVLVACRSAVSLQLSKMSLCSSNDFLKVLSGHIVSGNWEVPGPISPDM